MWFLREVGYYQLFVFYLWVFMIKYGITFYTLYNESSYVMDYRLDKSKSQLKGCGE